MLRQGARDLRELARAARRRRELRGRKEQHARRRSTACCASTSARRRSAFVWQWTDKDKGFHRDGAMTPQEFAGALRHAAARRLRLPRATTRAPSSPLRPDLHRRVPRQRRRRAAGDLPQRRDRPAEVARACDTIVGGEPVWFGCDVGKMIARRARHLGRRASTTTTRVYDTELDLDKADRLLHHESLMTHAMLFTGVDVRRRRPAPLAGREQLGRREGRQGLLHDERLRGSPSTSSRSPCAATRCRRSCRPRSDEPIVLPAWDPMGALAAS